MAKSKGSNIGIWGSNIGIWVKWPKSRVQTYGCKPKVLDITDTYNPIATINPTPRFFHTTAHGQLKGQGRRPGVQQVLFAEKPRALGSGFGI